VLSQALEQAVEGEVLQLSAWSKSVPDLMKDLAHEDSRVRDYAVRVLGERKSREAVPALIERLKDSNREVSLRAVGALGAIGDESAVPALIELTTRKDKELLLSVLGVIATIGGDDAEGFLFTLASGHPEEDVRQAAEEAQARMRHAASGASLGGPDSKKEEE